MLYNCMIELISTEMSNNNVILRLYAYLQQITQVTGTSIRSFNKKHVLWFILVCFILLFAWGSLDVVHIALLGHDIIYSSSQGLKIIQNDRMFLYYKENSSIGSGGLANNRTEGKNKNTTNMKLEDLIRNKPSFINYYDWNEKIYNMTSFPCIRALGYKPPFHICTYNSDEDVHISSALHKKHIWENHVQRDIVGALTRDKELNFIDIGANIGAHSLYVATIGRRVLAVEPVLANVIRLHKSVVLNRFQNKITLITNAISDKRSRVALVAPPGGSINQGAFIVDKSQKNMKDVQTIIMDDLLKVTNFTKAVIKIDIEGHEPEAFAHADKLLSKIQIPLISMEFGLLRGFYQKPESKEFKDIQTMLKLLYSKGYSAYGDNQKLKPEDWGKWPWDIKFIK